MQIKIAISGYDMIKRHRKKDEEISPLDIYKRAVDFATVFEWCVTGEMLFVPAYANFALSFELCLKAIAKNETNIIQSGHDLSKIFSKLKETTQDNIIRKFNIILKQCVNTEFSTETFYSNLKKIATTFYDYRYEYEWGTGKGFMINDLFFRCFGVTIFDYAKQTIK
ncbi:MAG: hypothetical protein J1G04_01605 [Clostridiales bacterium]|nr:hypothetical protein [Clostridiales bacterium]